MDFKVLFSQLSVLYAKLTKQQKIIIATAIVGIVAFLIFLVVFTAKKTSGSGYEVLFDKQKFDAISFDQKIKHLRALEGELSRTITALSPVEKAIVNLSLSKGTLSVSKQVDPTASVMVQLVEGRMLTLKQIRGIKNLVVTAVPKLRPSNVMLIDSDGVILGDNDEMAQMSELSVAQQKYKTKEEKKRQEKIIDVIAPFVGGKDKVVAQVTIEFDFSQKKSTSEKYDPENVVRSEQESEEKREGSSPKQVERGQGLASNKTVEKYSKNSGTTNYEVGKTVSTNKSQFARIKRITAAVVIDGKYKNKKDKNGNLTDEMKYVPLDNTDISALTSLASRSIGIDSKRGDQINVQNLQFERASVNKDAKGVNQAIAFSKTYLAPFSNLFKYLLVLILLFILYKKVIVPFVDKMLEVSKEEDFVVPSLELDQEEGDDLVEKVQQMRKKVEDQLSLESNFNEDDLKHKIILEKVKTMAEDTPEEVASLLEALLSEEAEIPAKERK